jgi:hypothetical protein
VLRSALAAYGTPGGIDPIPTRVLKKTLFQLVSPSLVFSQATDFPATTDPLDAVAFADLQLEPTADCARLTPSGNDPRASFVALGGSRLYARPSYPGEAQLFLSLDEDFTEGSSRKFDIGTNEVTVIALPDLGADSPWHVRFDPPASGSTTLCYSIH